MAESRDAIEILGPWLHNKGDDLMLRAVTQRLGGSYALAVSSPLGLDALPPALRLHGIRWRPTVAELGRAVRSRSLAAGLSVFRRGAGLLLAPRALARNRGIVDGSDLCALLDCSGFAYGDQWHPHRLRQRLEYYARLRQRGVKLVMLPQALGPFNRPEVAEPARRLLEQFDLIFARDRLSRQHVLSLGFNERQIGLCPDISHLLLPDPPADAAAWASRVCIVPNARMLDRVSPQVGAAYASFLAHCIRRMHERGLEAVVVLHESNDRDLASRVAEASGQQPRIIDQDALATKAILGACCAMIGSRYHGLVSALSQGTPSIGTSWSHKYDALFEEYDACDWLISPALPIQDLDRRMAELLEPVRLEQTRACLKQAAQRQKQKAEAMWAQVEQLLAGAVSRPSRLLEPIGRRFRGLVHRGMARGADPAWFGYRHLRHVMLSDYCAGRMDRPGGRCQTLHPPAVANNPLPRNITDRSRLPDDPGWWGYSFRDVPGRRSGATLLATIRDARIAWYRDPKQDQDFYPAIVTGDGCAIEARELRLRPRHARVLREARPVRLKRATWITERVYHNHSHWLTAHLPKLLLLQQRGALAEVLLPAPAERTAAMDESMRLIGLEPEQFATFGPERPLRVEELTLLVTDRFRPELLRLVSEAYGVLDAPRPWRRVFISRAGATRRRLVNEEAVWSLLEPAGFERVRMEQLSFAEQVRLMRETAVLWGPHGAGLTNMLFCPPGAQVVEMADLSFPNPNFYALASALRHDYWLLSAQGEGEAHPLERDLRADLDSIAPVLEALA